MLPETIPISSLTDEKLINEFYILFNVGQNDPEVYEKYIPLMREIAIEMRKRHIL